jgi:DNA adenine methylase
MGSKNKIAKEILPIILSRRNPNQFYIEPFCGGCNIIDKVENHRIANDIDPYLIALCKYLQEEIPFNPPHISENYYKTIRDNKTLYPKWLIGYVGYNLTFGSKFFGGYRRDIAKDYSQNNEYTQNRRAKENILKQQPNLQNINFYCMDYTDLIIPHNSIIYCDPPYKDTTKYKNEFDHYKFYKWCMIMYEIGHTIFISEYDMPEKFTCIWQKEVSSDLKVHGKDRKKIERLYTLKY